MDSNIPSLKHAALKSCIAHQELHVLLPESQLVTLFKHFVKMWMDKEFDYLYLKYCDLKLFIILLNEKYRTTLLRTFSSVNIRNGKPSVADVLLESYKESNAIKNDIELGLKFAQFFIELGIFTPAINFLEVVAETCRATNNQEMLIECYGQLIYAFSFEYKFRDALTTYSRLTNIFSELSPLPNCANVFSNISFMHFMLGDFYQALVEANLAIKELNNQLPVKVIIKVLRLSSRVFIVNREYCQSRLLIQHALTLSDDCYHSDPYIKAEVGIDYGFYLSKISYRNASIKVYQKTMELYRKIYKDPNLYHFIAERDLIINILKLTKKEASANDMKNIWINAASNYLTSAAKDIIKLGKGKYIMYQTSLCEVRALLLEKYAFYKPLSPTERRESLLTAKQCYELSLRNHRLYLDEARSEPSIKTVDCLISIGRVCQYLKELSSAEIAFKRAEAITKTLKCRSNAEYFGVQIYRVKLYRMNTNFFRRRGTILLAINTMERCKRLLIRFEGYNCEILDKFYHELIQLYNRTGDVTRVANYKEFLLQWRTQFNAHKPLTNWLPNQVSMKTIIDKIRKMNIDNHIRKFDYAIQISRNET